MKEKIIEILKNNYTKPIEWDFGTTADEIIELIEYDKKHQTIPYFKMRLIKMIEKFNP